MTQLLGGDICVRKFHRVMQVAEIIGENYQQIAGCIAKSYIFASPLKKRA